MIVVIRRTRQVDVCTQGNLRPQVSIGFVMAVLSINPVQEWKVVVAMTASAIVGHEWVILVMKIAAVYP